MPAGAGVREVLALQSLLSLLGNIAGANQSLAVGKLTALPAGANGSRAAAR